MINIYLYISIYEHNFYNVDLYLNYIDVVIIYLQKRRVEMNPMARDVNRHRQLEEEHPPRIERT